MTVTGLHLRRRARQLLVSLLDRTAERLDGPTAAAPAPEAPAAPAVVAPAPEPPAAPVAPPAAAPAAEPVAPLPVVEVAPPPAPAKARKPKPLPSLDKPEKAAKKATAPSEAEAAPARKPRAKKAAPAPEPAPAPVAAAAPPKPAATAATPAGTAAVDDAAERQRRHREKTRKGLLKFVSDSGGKAGLRELHEHSERTYFVAHVGFSQLMEELTDHGLLSYDHDTAVATLTDAGRSAMA